MQYQCPKCQSRKILPAATENTPAARPVVPKSLVLLIPSIFVLLLLVIISIAMWIFGNGAGQNVQIATVVVFIVSIIAALLFWRDLPDFKISMQSFMNANKEWKCRDCSHQWHV